MNVLIIGATEMELQPLRSKITEHAKPLAGLKLAYVCTGPGLLNAAFSITRAIIESHPDLILQFGISGSLSDAYPPGAVVAISQETLGDTGVWDIEGFRDLFDMGLLRSDQPPFTEQRLHNPHLQKWRLTELPAVIGVSVNQVTTENRHIQLLKQKYNAVSESMEGAALHYAALSLGTPFIQIRGISNFVGQRDKSAWQIEVALEQAAIVAIHFLSELQP